MKNNRIIRSLYEIYEVNGLNEKGNWPRLKLIYRKGKYNILHNTDSLKEILFINKIINEEQITFEDLLKDIQEIYKEITKTSNEIIK